MSYDVIIILRVEMINTAVIIYDEDHYNYGDDNDDANQDDDGDVDDNFSHMAYPSTSIATV